MKDLPVPSPYGEEPGRREKNGKKGTGFRPWYHFFFCWNAKNKSKKGITPHMILETYHETMRNALNIKSVILNTPSKISPLAQQTWTGFGPI